MKCDVNGQSYFQKTSALAQVKFIVWLKRKEVWEVKTVFNKKQFAHVFDVNSFKKLRIDLTSTDLVIHQGDALSVIYYDEKNDHDRLIVKQEGTVLNIHEKRGLENLTHSLAFKFAIGKSRLEITLPPKEQIDIKATVDSGDVAISNITVPQIFLKTNSGAVTLAYSRFKKLNISTQESNLVMKMMDIEQFILDDDTGDVLLDQINIEDRLIASIDEGNLKLRKDEFNDGKITLGAGDVSVREFTATGDFKLTTDVGDLSLRAIKAPTITIAAVRGNDLENPAIVKGLPNHKDGTKGATFLTTAGHLDVYKDIEVI